MNVDANKLFVTTLDGHFIVIHSETEDDARHLKGKILGNYLSSDKAHAARDTMRTIAALGFPLKAKG